MMRALTLVASLLATLAVPAATNAAASASPPPIKHVFILVLENKGFNETFGKDSKAPYLAQTLPAQGELLPNYYATTHLSLGNYIALISGQASNPQTQADCLFFNEFLPGTIGPDGQAVGQGCVYPAAVKTIADQLTAKGLTWKGYMEDMGNSPTESKTCRHPTIGGQDHTQSAKKGDQYAARHNPFVYFHSIIDTPACAANDVPLDRLPADLASASTTANYSFITPNLCNDAHDAPCVDGKPGGLVSADAFLRQWVPRILASPAYRQDGLLLVTFDEAEATPGSGGDASACCDQPPGPNSPNPGGPVAGPGGGKTGMVALSPWIRPGTINSTPYNHYSLLRSTEDIFGLAHLGYAARPGLRGFGSEFFTGTGPAKPPTPRRCGDRAVRRARNGSILRGNVIQQPRIVRGVLSVRFRHGARLSGTVRPISGRGRTRRLSTRTVRSCRSYRIALPSRHGRLDLRATVGRAVERRLIRY